MSMEGRDGESAWKLALDENAQHEADMSLLELVEEFSAFDSSLSVCDHQWLSGHDARKAMDKRTSCNEIRQ
jgi:hypothetical protein